MSGLAWAWANQHTIHEGDSWERAMYDSWLDPQRIQLVKAIERACKTPGSILEVGCGSGPNLRLWRAQWPSADLTGMDVNAVAVGWGQKQAWSEGWDWTPVNWPLERLKDMPGPFDVVVSCYTLTYIDPNEIDSVLQQLVRLTKTALVIMEPMVSMDQEERFYPGREEGGEGYHEFWYDYPTRLKKLLPHGQVQIEPMTPWGHLNGIVTILPTLPSA